MSRIVSIRLPTVHRPTIPPTHSSQPEREAITPLATGSSAVRTTGGIPSRNAWTEASRCPGSPTSTNTAATVMKNGNSARIAM